MCLQSQRPSRVSILFDALSLGKVGGKLSDTPQGHCHSNASILRHFRDVVSERGPTRSSFDIFYPDVANLPPSSWWSSGRIRPKFATLAQHRPASSRVWPSVPTMGEFCESLARLVRDRSALIDQTQHRSRTWVDSGRFDPLLFPAPPTLTPPCFVLYRLPGFARCWFDSAIRSLLLHQKFMT